MFCYIIWTKITGLFCKEFVLVDNSVVIYVKFVIFVLCPLFHACGESIGDVDEFTDNGRNV